MSIEKVPGGKIIRQGPVHRCPQPDTQCLDIGDIFACDCGRRYVLVPRLLDLGGPYWSPVTQAGDGGR